MEFWLIIQDAFLLLGMLFAAPFGRIYDVVVMNCWLGWKTTEKEHSKKVAGIQAEVQKWKAARSKKKLCTSRPGWRSISPSKTDKSGRHPIPVSSLNRVINIDKQKKEITVEPEMMMGQLTRLLVPMGWTIPVILEVETLTIGGLIAGAGLESSSHKYGMISDTAVSYEIVLPNGNITVCSMEKDQELFRAIPHSYGTLGFITAVTFRLIRATPFVKLQYHYVKGAQEAEDLICGDGRKHEFIEGFGYPDEEFVIMLGDFHDGEPPQNKVNKLNAWYKQFFHHQAKAVMEKLKKEKGKTVYEEYLPTIQYYHRHSRGLFWMLERTNIFVGLKVFPLLFGYLLPVNTHIQRIAPFMNRLVQNRLLVQDYGIPVETWKEFYKKACKELQIYPVWICPGDNQRIASIIHESLGFGIDVAFYGKPPKGSSKELLLRRFEDFAIQCGGAAAAYADCYLTESQFLKMYDHTSYFKVRKAVGADKAFPTIYEKISPIARGLIKS